MSFWVLYLVWKRSKDLAVFNGKTNTIYCFICTHVTVNYAYIYFIVLNSNLLNLPPIYFTQIIQQITQPFQLIGGEAVLNRN
jgi:hypothetical protein